MYLVCLYLVMHGWSFIASIACWLRRLLFIVSFTAYRLTSIALYLLTPVSSSLLVYGLAPPHHWGMAEQTPQPKNQQQDQPVPQPLQEQGVVSAVALKIPPFWPADPAVWFAQVEAQFSIKDVVQQRTRFDHIVAALAPDVITEVRDVILHPPAERPYDRLKEALIQRTKASEQRCLQQLLTAEEMGDRKPSQLLRHMQHLLGDWPCAQQRVR